MFSHWTATESDPRFVIQVHGGAWNIPESLKTAHIEGVRRAYQTALAALRKGASPLDAVVDSLVVLEDDPAFDAGTGSFLNEDGNVRADHFLNGRQRLMAQMTAGLGHDDDFMHGAPLRGL